MQAAGGSTTIATARDIVKTEGVRGLYRGGLPLVLGGALYVATFMLIPNLEFIHHDAAAVLDVTVKVYRLVNNHNNLPVVNEYVVIFCA